MRKLKALISFLLGISALVVVVANVSDDINVPPQMLREGYGLRPRPHTADPWFQYCISVLEREARDDGFDWQTIVLSLAIAMLFEPIAEEFIQPILRQLKQRK